MSRERLRRALEGILHEPIDSVKRREHGTLEDLIERSRGRVVLFGAGGVGRQSLVSLRSIGVEPLAISDNDAARWHTEVDGIRVSPPEEAATRFGADALFIVTIWNPHHWYHTTERQLHALGCSIVAPPAVVFWRFSEAFPALGPRGLPRAVYEQGADVLRAGAIWDDDLSRDEYRRQIEARTRGMWDFKPPCPDQHSYFLAEHFTVESFEAFVDCGAFNGDTLDVFLKLSRSSFRKYVAIEADPKAYAALRKSVDALDDEIRARVDTVAAFVGASAATAASAAVSLGDICARVEPVTFIKMDIEGAERNALLEARADIERDQPLLAICAYHTHHDLWSLPLLMKEMVPSHRMFLRSYEGDGWQTVAYAVPPGRHPESKAR